MKTLSSLILSFVILGSAVPMVFGQTSSDLDLGIQETREEREIRQTGLQESDTAVLSRRRHSLETALKRCDLNLLEEERCEQFRRDLEELLEAHPDLPSIGTPANQGMRNLGETRRGTKKAILSRRKNTLKAALRRCDLNLLEEERCEKFRKDFEELESENGSLSRTDTPADAGVRRTGESTEKMSAQLSRRRNTLRIAVDRCDRGLLEEERCVKFRANLEKLLETYEDIPTTDTPADASNIHGSFMRESIRKEPLSLDIKRERENLLHALEQCRLELISQERCEQFQKDLENIDLRLQGVDVIEDDASRDDQPYGFYDPRRVDPSDRNSEFK